MKVLLSLGANLGDRIAALRAACECINRLPDTRVLRCSSLYATDAVEVPGEQPEYLNCVVEAQSDMPPAMLLGACLGIEASCGRLRPGYKSPRTLDIDMLMYEAEDGSTVISSDERVTLPHPRMGGRAFVLIPLSELYPGMIVQGVDLRDALRNTLGQRVTRIADASEILPG